MTELNDWRQFEAPQAANDVRSSTGSIISRTRSRIPNRLPASPVEVLRDLGVPTPAIEDYLRRFPNLPLQ